MLVLHTVIAIVAVVLLIIKFKLDPVIALVIGSLYLGLAGGVGFPGTIEAITKGFGNIMTSVGLLIGFGVLIGSLLHTTGAFTKMVRALLGIFGPSRIPYGLSLALATIFPSIYVDVQVVLAAPVARQAARHMGPNGLGRMAGALGIGIFAGYVFVVPGLAAISICGLMGIPLGKYLMFGIVLGPLTAFLTVLIFGLMLRAGWWRPATDEEESEALLESEARAAELEASGGIDRLPSLWLSMLPILVPLLLIAFGAFAELFEFTNQFIDFIGNANVALFVGLLLAYFLSRATVGEQGAAEAFGDGLHTSGEILLVTGIGGSLGAVIKATGLASLLGDMFSADSGAPVIMLVLLAWLVAAVLHLAIGSVSVAAITGAGIIAPLLGQVDANPVVLGLAIASGSLFALHVNSNFFWMFKALLGLSTLGSLKSMTTVTTIGSLVSLPLVVGLGLVM